MKLPVYTAEGRTSLRAWMENEWSVQNGAGAYAGSTLCLAPARHHHNLLTASLCAPVQRTAVWQDLDMVLELEDGSCHPLSPFRLANDVDLDGWQPLARFTWDGLPCWEYQVGDITLTLRLAMERGKNTTGLAFAVKTGSQKATLRLAPYTTWRPVADINTAEHTAYACTLTGEGAVLTPAAAPDYQLRFFCDAEEMTVSLADHKVEDIYLRIEDETGNPTPILAESRFEAAVELPAGAESRFSLVGTIEADCCKDAFALVDAEYTRLTALLENCGLPAGKADSEAAARLVLASDQFVTYRSSIDGMTVLAGLPWFTDWGRDTMIAFEGCCLATKRFDEARSILETFARYEAKGLVPNMFPDAGTAPLYNTVDGSLWYFVAVALYNKYTDNAHRESFVQAKLWPCMKNILAAYEKGTDFSIGMDEADALVHAGGGYDQVTWMDVRVGDWVATPRHGKPVEINALWYAALRIGADLAGAFGEADSAAHYTALAERVRASYAPAFWNEAGQALHDVIAPEGPDDTLRCNQLLAVSLWRCLPAGTPALLTPAQEAAVVATVEAKLYAGPGIRTLPQGHPDYHPRYIGSLNDRDHAYHQGTAWGWWMGEFLFAHQRVHGDSAAEVAELRRLMAPALEQLDIGAVNGIAEIFDADAPHYPRGCFSQAWSIGEVLAALRSLVLG